MSSLDLTALGETPPLSLTDSIPAQSDDATVITRGWLSNYTHLNNSLSTCVVGDTDISPESVTTYNTTPPPRPQLRQHRPILLPKSRGQDSGSNHLNVSTGQSVHRRALSKSSNGRPRVQRSVTEPVENTGDFSPVSCFARASSVAPSPGLTNATLHPVVSRTHSRSVSATTINDGVPGDYGFPSYHQVPLYFSEPYKSPCPTVYRQPDISYLPSLSVPDTPPINIEGPFNLALDLSCNTSAESLPRTTITGQAIISNHSTRTQSLLSYLTSQTQPLNLCHTLTPSAPCGSIHHFWWDIRQIRPWSSFSFATLTSIPDLLPLLNFPHPSTSFPPTSHKTTVTPQDENDLAAHLARIHFPRANLAATLSLGPYAPQLYLTSATTTTSSTNANLQRLNTPHFLASYASDLDRTLSGLPRGRLVGLSRSFERFNSGMRRESPAKRVEYLKTLAHLHKVMRDHSCRYGFVITEIEMVVVRAMCDTWDRPWFGALEVAEEVPLKNVWTLARVSTTSSGNEKEVMGMSVDEGDGERGMTVGLALWGLLMLAKKTALPGMRESFMDVGSGGVLSRQRVWKPVGEAEAGRIGNGDVGMERLRYVNLGNEKIMETAGKDGKDAWIPEPKLFETREAKTVRGWVWPMDPFHKREAGGKWRKGGVGLF